jgi:hypothetical protein
MIGESKIPMDERQLFFNQLSAHHSQEVCECSAIRRRPPGMQFANEQLSHIAETKGARLVDETVEVALQLKDFLATGFSTVNVQRSRGSFVLGNEILMQISANESTQSV